MKIVCDNCSTKYSIADEKVRGKVFKIKCKKCSHIIVVKGEATTGEGQPAGFDQKETRVFDYSGFEGQRAGGSAGAAAGAAAAAAGDAAADPIWHLVIDREQVGPLTVAELAAKWDAGEIDRETYAWREGFADWQRLGAIEELGSLIARTGVTDSRAAPAAAPGEGRRPSPVTDETDAGGLFGGATSTPSAATSGAGRSDPADLFGSAGSSTEDEAPSDLFSGASDRAAAAAAPPGGGGVFSSSVAATGGSATAGRGNRSVREELFGSEGGADVGGAEPLAAAPRAEVRSMTGQRNENSVLFSLNNLSALAASEPAAAPAQSRSSSGLSSFGASGAEGSGLIDIRAMAAMTLGATKKEEQTGPRTRASEDDLPVFSATSFSAPAAGVLLPTVQPQNNKLVYIMLGLIGLLAVAAIVLVAVIFLGKKEPEPGSEVSAVTTPSTEPATTAPSTATPSATAPSTAPPSAPTTAPSTTPSTPPSTTPSTPPAATPPPAATTERPAATPPKAPDRRPERTPATRTEPKSPSAPPPAASNPTPPPAAAVTPPAAPPKKEQKCDEVACLVTPDLPCCPKKGGSTAAKPAAGGADSGLPDQLEQADIIAGMRNVNGRVMACNDRFRVPGGFKVKITVAPDGSVSAASAGPPIAGTGAAGCVESAVKGAKFKRSKRAITFNYPYTFR